MKKFDLKYYGLSFIVVVLLSFIIVYLQHLQIIPQNFKTGPFFYKFNSNLDFVKKMTFVVFLLYLIPIGIKRSNNSKKNMICPKCEHVEEVLKADMANKECSKCSTKMKPLEGFYDK